LVYVCELTLFTLGGGKSRGWALLRLGRASAFAKAEGSGGSNPLSSHLYLPGRGDRFAPLDASAQGAGAGRAQNLRRDAAAIRALLFETGAAGRTSG